MDWKIFAGLAVASLGMMLLGLRAAVWLRARAAMRAPVAKRKPPSDWAEFETEYTRSDAYVAYSDRIWPYITGDAGRDIRPLYIIIPAVLTSSILVTYGFFAAYVIANNSLIALALLSLIAPLANVVQANYATTVKPLTGALAATIILIAVFNAGYSFIGASITGNALATQADISAGDTNAKLKSRDQMQAQLVEIRNRRAEAGNLPLETLETRAKSARDKEYCESYKSRRTTLCPADKVAAREYGGKCGPKCQEFKSEADKLDSQVADARSEKSLQTRLASINTELSEAGFIRTEAAPVAVMGWEARQDNIQIVVVIFVTILDAFLWMRLGGEARERREQYRRQARENANITLANQGLDPRYTLDDGPEAAALPAPEKREGDNVTISVEADPMVVINASERLSEIHNLFGDALKPDEDKSVTFGTLRQVYEIRSEQAGRKKIMAQHTFTQTLRQYLELRGIAHAAARISGYRLGVDSSAETKEAAE